MIGPVAIVSEASIGSNTRRIEAVTGEGSFTRLAERDRLLESTAALLRAEPDTVPEAVERLLERQRAAEKALEQARGRERAGEARLLVAEAVSGAVVARRDGLGPDELRELAQLVRGGGRLRAVVIGGSPDGAKASLAVAVDPAAGLDATAVVRQVAGLLGGGGGGSPEVAVAGGRDPAGIDAALEAARAAVDGG